MPTTTVRPDGVAAGASNATLTGGASANACLSDNSDASYISGLALGSIDLTFGTFSIPANAAMISAQSRIRMRSQSNGNLAQVRTTLNLNGVQTFYGHSSSTISTINTSAYTGAVSQGSVDAVQLNLFCGIVSFYPDIMEAYIDFLYANGPSAPTVSAPTGSITTTRKPTVSWTHNGGTDSLGQTKFQVKVFTAAVYGGGGFDANTSSNVYDSGVITSSSASHVPSSFIPNGGVNYKAYVRTYQTTNGVDQVSAWTAGPTFSIAITVPVPTSLTPVNSATVTSSKPAIGADVGVMTGGSNVRRQWDIASNVGFSTALQTYTDPVAATTKAGSITFPGSLSRLAQGVWYIRARTVDDDGQFSSYTSTNSFTVAHVPTTTGRTPSANATVAYSTTPTVSWTFSDVDTDDFQLKFQVQMWKTSAPGTVLDSGLVTSGNQFYQFTSGIDATWKDTEIRWKVLVQDQDSVSSGYSSEATFYLRDLPTIAVTAPAAAAVITTSAPLVTWTFSGSGSRTEAQWKVDIIRGGVTQITSGFIAGTALSWQVPSPVVTVGPTHTVQLTVIDSLGLTNVTSNNFTASYAAPTTPVFTVDATTYAATGKYLIDWSGATVDGNFTAWRVYRRKVGASTWTLLFETSNVGTRSYKDYLAPSQEATQYAVVQVGVSFAVIVESVYAPVSVTTTSPKYQLVCPSNDTLNLNLFNVGDDSFGDEQEMAIHNLIGRGRNVEYGTRYGQMGSMVATLYDQTGLTARQQRLAVEALRSSGLEIYLRTPFGDVWKVALTGAKITRVPGMGLHEACTVAFDYAEVTA